MGYAHVQFESPDSLEAALARDGAYLGERFLTVEASRAVAEGPGASLAQSQKAQPKGCATIFVKGVPYEADEAALAAVFSRFGAITSTRLPRWGHTGTRKGHGYVQFSAPAAAGAAVTAYRASAGTSAALRVGDRLVHLDYDDGAPKASFKTEAGRAFYKTEAKEGGGSAGAAGGKGGAAGGHYWPRAKKSEGGAASGGKAAEGGKGDKLRRKDKAGGA
jgi:RNA recognition motif-containing protein